MTRTIGRRTVRRALLAAFLSATAVAPATNPAASAQTAPTNAVNDWNATAGAAARAVCLAPTNDPLHESRLYAIAHIAIHDALNSIDRRFRPYAYADRATSGASVMAAVAAAAHDALVATLEDLPPEVFPPGCSAAAGIAIVETKYAADLAAIPNGPAKERGLAVGRAAAAAIVDERAGDGVSEQELLDFTPRGGPPGAYQITPGFTFAFAPDWGDVTPFTLKNSNQFVSGPPYRLTSRKYAVDFNEVKRLGSDDITAPSERTDEQTEIALFWVESSPLAWNRMARAIATDRGLDMWESARLFGLLNMGMADGYIGTFQEKYDYNFWRPVTAIRRADEDRNARTAPDSDWLPLVPTPPIPDHDSGHSVEGGVAYKILQRVLGTDKVSFEVCSLTLNPGQTCDDPAPVMRTFSRLSDAAVENGDSRVFVGFHFRHAVVDGIAHGKKIGNWAVSHFMGPAPG